MRRGKKGKTMGEREEREEEKEKIQKRVQERKDNWRTRFIKRQ